MEENRLFEEQGQFSLCLRVRESLPDLIEGYLDAAVAETIRAHLSVCYLCARVLGEMERTIKLVETLPFAEPARDLTPQILAAIQAQPDYCFQTPVVEMETQVTVGVSAPRSTTGRQRQLDSWVAGALRRARLLFAGARSAPAGGASWRLAACAQPG